MKRESWRQWATAAGICVAVGVLSGTQFYAGWTGGENGRGTSVSFIRLVLWQTLLWLTWAPLAPVVAAFVRRWPLRLNSRRIVMHVGASVLVALLRLVLVEVVSMIASPLPNSPSRAMLPRLRSRFGGSFQIEVLIYWGIASAVQAFDDYRRSRDRGQRLMELEARLAVTELDALRLQLQPHFLFNTLHTIGSLVREAENAKAVAMIAQLSELLRYSLDTIARQRVPLRQELDMVRVYADIQVTRFADDLSIEVDAAPDTLDVLVPSLLLQPLVENAVRHGVSCIDRPGQVTVRAYAASGRLVLAVSDNGPGPSPTIGDDRRGIGLANTRARLQLLYGDAQSFGLTTGPTGGATLTISLPFEVAEA